ncbi:methyltransferase [Lasiosphaeria hispida]|uniref:Methyltransferase n=1 Tax=Lasiosphaeria hispida TaxID=260671 RepID=A0AAJ0HAL0_9PEZI|nr:methyltransferase [Lasiosphaeria hispida]
MGGLVGRPLPPTSCLPPPRQLDSLSETQISCALNNLFAIYHPTAVPKSVLHEACKPYKPSTRFAPLTDSGYNSGYTSENDDDDDDDNVASGEERGLALLRADEFERAFATRWLEKLIARAAEDAYEPLACFSSDEARQTTVEKASDLLTALLNFGRDDAEQEDDAQDDSFCREFAFARDISVRLNDGLAGRRADDHTDVGLQTWGASIVFCQMLCDSPARFGLSQTSLGCSPRIVELGAGTGLVSLVLAQLLPGLGLERSTLVATDYHPAVISNLRRNIAANLSASSDCAACPVQACVLDWALAEMDPAWPLGDDPADVLFATDVIYAHEHAEMLHACASRQLAPDGVFWLLQTVRRNGRFGGVADTVEAVFGKVVTTGGALRILDSQRLEKPDSVGRGDEASFELFQIGWSG